MSVCAMHLSPVLILRELKAGNYAKARRFGLMDCVECGCCAFICPANVRIVQRIRLGKGVVRQQMADAKIRAEPEPGFHHLKMDTKRPENGFRLFQTSSKQYSS